MSDPLSITTTNFVEFCERTDPVYEQRGDKFQCPCCTCFTLDGAGDYHICPVCFWEDDGTTNEHGFSPNNVSLAEGRANYQKFGACEDRVLQYVRQPEASELP